MGRWGTASMSDTTDVSGFWFVYYLEVKSSNSQYMIAKHWRYKCYKIQSGRIFYIKMVDKWKQLANSIHHSELHCDRISQACANLNESLEGDDQINYIKISTPVDTRWNSTLFIYRFNTYGGHISWDVRIKTPLSDNRPGSVPALELISRATSSVGVIYRSHSPNTRSNLGGGQIPKKT